MRTLCPVARINGLDLGRLYGTIDAFRCDPALARFVYRAHNRWLDGPRSQSRILSCYGAGSEQRSREVSFLLDSDSAPVLFGEDRAACPQEHLLHALAACLTTTLVAQAAAHGMVLDAVETAVEADVDLIGVFADPVPEPPALRRIRASMVVRSASEPAQLDGVFLAVRQRSVLLHALAVPVDLDFLVRS